MRDNIKEKGNYLPNLVDTSEKETRLMVVTINSLKEMNEQRFKFNFLYV